MSIKPDAASDAENLTTSEAADYLRLSVSTLERLRSNGGGPVFQRMGHGRRNRITYRRCDLETWLAALRFNSTSEYGR